MGSEGADSASEPGPSTTAGQDEQKAEKTSDSTFECNICLDTAKNAVISMCGHLFCWPCLHQWLETRPNRQTCPVCKSAVSHDKVIPLYGRGGDGSDPRAKAPPRPQGQRSEPTYSGFPGFNWGGAGAGWGDNQAGGGLQFSFGIGAFPFTMFATTMNFGEQRPNAAQPGTPEYQEEQSMSRIFLWLALIFIVWLMLA